MQAKFFDDVTIWSSTNFGANFWSFQKLIMHPKISVYGLHFDIKKFFSGLMTTSQFGPEMFMTS